MTREGQEEKQDTAEVQVKHGSGLGSGRAMETQRSPHSVDGTAWDVLTCRD